MKIMPSKKIQLVFHRGSKKQALPSTQIIIDTSGLLSWKTNDRAVATFNTAEDITAHEKSLVNVVQNWIAA